MSYTEILRYFYWLEVVPIIRMCAIFKGHLLFNCKKNRFSIYGQKGGFYFDVSGARYQKT